MLEPHSRGLITEMSQNLIRRQSYLCGPLTWTSRIIYSNVARYLSQGSEKELRQHSFIDGFFDPGKLPFLEVVKLDVVQQKLDDT